MKKLGLYMLAAWALLAACTREEAPRTGEIHESNAATITVMAGGAGTRTWMTEDGSGFQFKWKKGDRIAIEEGVATSSGGYSETYYSNALETDMEEGLFTVSLEDRDLSGSQNLSYTAVYPAAVHGWGSYNRYGQLRLGLYFPTIQYPSVDCFDPDADVLVSQEVIRSARPGDGEQLTFRFARVGTIVKMVLNGLPEGWVLKDGFVSFDFPAGYYAEYCPAEKILTDNDGGDNIYFSYTGRDGDKPGITIGPDRSAVVWLRCLSGKTDFLIVNLNQQASGDYARRRRISLRAMGQKMEFKEGGLTTFTVNFAPADVENPDEESVQYLTNAAMDGVTVSWPASDDEDLAGYEAFLVDEEANQYEFTAGPALSADESRWEAVISQGLEPGRYTLFVRAKAVDGKVSQPDYLECHLDIALPLHQTITGGMLPETGYEDHNYEFSYESITYGYRNMYYSTGWNASPSREQTWAFWTKNPLHLGTVSVTPRNNNTAEFQVYASDEPFVDGHPHESEEPLPYTLVYGNKQFQADGKAYLLIESRESIWLNSIGFDYYH